MISKKKRSSLKFDRFLLPRSRWRPKKKGSSLGFDRFFLPKSRWRQKKGFCGIFCNSQRQRGSINQSTNQCKNLSRVTLKPLAGRVLDALDVGSSLIVIFIDNPDVDSHGDAFLVLSLDKGAIMLSHKGILPYNRLVSLSAWLLHWNVRVADKNYN